MGVRSGSKRKRRRAASPGAADLISGLGDDVLACILELLPDAGDAVRKGVLSRRWRGLWTRLRSLTFDSGSRRNKSRRASVDQRFLDMVHSALAQRARSTTDAAAAAALDLEHLAISFTIMSPADDQETKPLILCSAVTAQEWVRHAVHKKVKSFVLKLQLFPIRVWYRRVADRCNIWELPQQLPVIDLINLPSSAKLETMHWELKGIRLRLPATAVFTSLADLSLENIELVTGTGHLLARLLSLACSPSLLKLQLRNVMHVRAPRDNVLLIEASALLEASISSTPSAQFVTLKLKTPSLRILRIKEYVSLLTVAISAPKLEELTFSHNQWLDRIRIEVDGELPCLGSLKGVELDRVEWIW